MSNISYLDYVSKYKSQGANGPFGNRNIILNTENKTPISITTKLNPRKIDINTITPGSVRFVNTSKSTVVVTNPSHNIESERRRSGNFIEIGTGYYNKVYPAYYDTPPIIVLKQTNTAELYLIKSLGDQNKLSVATGKKTINVSSAPKVYTPKIQNKIYWKSLISMYIAKPLPIKLISDTKHIGKNTFFYHSQASHNVVCVTEDVAIYNNKLTKLTDENYAFDITLKENQFSDGFDDIGITIISGKYCEIRLSNASGNKIADIDNLPSSLKYDEDTNTILGIPFLVGTFATKITLSNNKIVTMNFNIVPISLGGGL